MSRPNILLLIADDHRHSAIGALGQEAVDTPTFDRLMAQGTTFTRASIMGATSDAVLSAQPRHAAQRSRPCSARPIRCRSTRRCCPSCCGRRAIAASAPASGTTTARVSRAASTPAGWSFLGGMSDQYAVPVYPWDAVRTQDESRLEINDTFSTTALRRRDRALPAVAQPGGRAALLRLGRFHRAARPAHAARRIRRTLQRERYRAAAQLHAGPPF